MGGEKKLACTLFLLNLCFGVHSASAGQFKLAYPGVQGIIDYSQYGEFEGIGTHDFKYYIDKTKRHGLILASGEGVYPDWRTVLKDPAYRKLKREGRLKGNHWSHVDTGDAIADFFVWVRAPEDYGVKQFFIAQALDEAGLFVQAVKAYYAVIIFFPRTPCWGADHSFVWYVGPEAVQRINQILNKHPEIGLKLTGADITIKNGKDTNLSNDIVTVNPGKFVGVEYREARKNIKAVRSEKVVQQRGRGKVKLLQYANGNWEMRVAGKSIFVKGMHYQPTMVGKGTDALHSWMFDDTDENGSIDAPYDSWVDINNNNKQDKKEKRQGDFELLKSMGCNAIRLYHSSPEGYDASYINKVLLRDLHQRFGISVIMGDFLGAYTLGSGADWNEGTDYTDPEQRSLMKKSVRNMVNDHKNEPYILMWVLGNENNMPADYTGVNATRTNAYSAPKAYAAFLQEVARMIHEIDPDHPVAVGNLEVDLLEYYARYAKEIDIITVNSYRGKRGFGSLWKEVQKTFDRPVLILEYGCDAYDKESGLDEAAQKEYHEGCWDDIVSNSLGRFGAGNSIGGVVFEWIDEWWKSTHAGDPDDEHHTGAQAQMPFPDGWSHEEWLGIVGQGNGRRSPFLRRLRETYYYYKKAWNK